MTGTVVSHVLTAPLVRDGRILAALRFTDAVTGEMVRRALDLRSDRLSFTRNLSGLFAVTGLAPQPGNAAEEALAAHLRAFDAAPAQPPAGSVTLALTVTDLSGRYLPRAVALALPRGDAWDQAVDVPLYPAPAAPLSPNWSGVRASLATAAGPLAGARLTLRRASDGAVLGRGFSDRRGEVLAIAAGIPVIDFTAPSNGAGPAPASVGTATTRATIAIETAPGEPWPPDPQAIDGAPRSWVPVAGTLPEPELRTGRLVTDGLSLTLQPNPRPS